jgi:D-serine deaminase-like pyridoxal phosphate-dependent protein
MLEALPTPCLLVEADKMQTNLDSMASHLGQHEVALRPHLKTCKNIEIARSMLDPRSGGAAVSTLAEADYFFQHGISDLLYAVGIAPGKLPGAAERIAKGMRLTVVLDHLATARAVGIAAQDLNCPFHLLLEIDCDGMRAGFRPDSDELIEAATILAKAGCMVSGVMVHAGGSYLSRSTDDIRAMAVQERTSAIMAAERLRTAGHEIHVISIGSTPTALFGENFEGVTEVRAGVHVFHDLVMAGLGVCSIEDIALSVLCEVIGHRSEAGQLIVDAGWMALSRDCGRAPTAPDLGYGLVRGLDGRDLGGLIVQGTNQEHGLIGQSDGQAVELAQYPIGTRLRILPNHACATAGQHAGYWLISADHSDPSWLERCAGW